MTKKIIALAAALATVTAMLPPLEAQRGTVGSYPCDLVSGCTAAYSLARRLVGTYTGPLFQLTRLSDGHTQDIGQTASGFVNQATVGTFCAATSCSYSIFYDQTSNANHLTAQISCACVAPYEVDAVRGWPMLSNNSSSPVDYFHNASPTNNPTGNVDKSVVTVATDLDTGATTSGFGTSHSLADGNIAGTTFMPGTMGDSSGAFRFFRVWFESDYADLFYGPGSSGTGFLTQVPPFSLRGDYIGIATYHASDTMVVLDYNGQYTYSVAYPVTVFGDHEIHLNDGGDGTPSPGHWYEGLIYGKTLSAGEREILTRNTQAYYGIVPRPSCSNGPRAETAIDAIGESIPWGAFGLRLVNPHWKGPIATLQRASDSTYKVIGASGCNFDVAAATTFCASTTCKVVYLWNQTRGFLGQISTALPSLSMNLSSTDVDYTPNCIGSLPCMTMTSNTQHLEIGNSIDFAAPYTVAMVALNNSTGFSQLFLTGANNPFIGGSASGGNQVTFYAGGSPVTATSTNNAWVSLAAVAVDSGHMAVYVNGTATTAANAVTDHSQPFTIGGAGVGTQQVAEILVVLGRALSSTDIQAMQANQRAYWGF